jgi:hypothetical protein
MLSLIAGFLPNELKDGIKNEKLSKSLLQGNYEQVLNESSLFNEIDQYLHSFILNNNNLRDDESMSRSSIFKALKRDLFDQRDKNDLAMIAVASLQFFVQLNWTGPLSKATENRLKGNKSNEDVEKTLNKLSILLEFDGETIVPSAKYLNYMIIASLILVEYENDLSEIEVIIFLK